MAPSLWPRDVVIAFLTRAIRMVNYGMISPVFFLFLNARGFSPTKIGALLTAILLGDLVITLYLSTRADAFGRKKTLVIASLLKVLAGVVFATASDFYVLAAAGVVGVISTSGGEIGPFMAVEQAVLTDALAAARAVKLSKAEESAAVAVTIGWYTALGYCAQALGALGSGVAVRFLPALLGVSQLQAYALVFYGYGALGALLAILYLGLSPACEAAARAPAADAPPAVCPAALAPWLPSVTLGLRRSASIAVVARLSALFALDAFAGAFVMQTWIAFWFAQRWGFSSDFIGYLLMGANVVAGASGIAAAYFVKKLGAMLTMIASHAPSNVLLLAVPLMPSGAAAAVMLVARFSISQMDVPARQAYVVSVVASDERSAAGGITNLVRSLGMSLAPLLLGYLSDRPAADWLFSFPWLLAGAIKLVYDFSLYGLYLCDKTLNEGEARAEKADKAEAAAATESAAAPLLSIQDPPEGEAK
jgi:MFS family permease